MKYNTLWENIFSENICITYIKLLYIKVVSKSEMHTCSHVMIEEVNGYGVIISNIWGLFLFLEVSRKKPFLIFKIFSEVSKSSCLGKNESLLFEENTFMLSLV